MTTTSKDLLDELDAPEYVNPEWEAYLARDRRRAFLLEAVKEYAREPLHEHQADHRTGCITDILGAVAEVLLNERGWSYVAVLDALVLEAVRAGGAMEAKRKSEAKAAWEARQKAKVSS